MKQTHPEIVIIGAGLQGLCVALGLAHLGIKSTVVESRPDPIRGASHGNEGKIHLGLVYALDTSMQTGMNMLRGALSFSTLMDKWCDPLPWNDWTSAGFRYAIMPDSMQTPSGLEDYYEQLRLLIPQAASELPCAADYFGRMPDWLWKNPNDTLGTPVVMGHPVTAIDTEEIAIDTALFSHAVTDKVRQHQLIKLLCNHRVTSAQALTTGYRLELETPDGTKTVDADTVINCAWNDRTRLDAMIHPEINQHQFSYRVKHRIIVQPKKNQVNLKPITMVQGPYGDIVPYRNGSVYLSWYPECRTYLDCKPPQEEIHATSVLESVADKTLSKMSEMLPDLAGSEVLSCSPCVIVAEGLEDVDNPESPLHRRLDTGPHGGNGWWSVNTGKLTLAPYYGELTSKLVTTELGIE